MATVTVNLTGVYHNLSLKRIGSYWVTMVYTDADYSPNGVHLTPMG